MIRKIINKILQVNYTKPIIDEYCYKNNQNSYSGGSLADKKILIVHNYNDINVIKNVIKKELAEVYVECKENICVEKDIRKTSLNMIGTFNNIVNIFELNNCDNIQIIKEVYQKIQVETDYLVKYREGFTSTIVNVLIFRSCKNQEVQFAVNNLIKGLSAVLGNHNIIINGINVLEDINSEIIGKWICMMSSKYGYILSGETVYLEYPKGKKALKS